MKCEYCGTDEQKGKTCDKCGAVVSSKRNFDEEYKSEPRFYNGYIIYWLEQRATETIEVQFWLGRELIQRVCVNRELLRLHVPEFGDSMTFFWDLFLIAQGEKEVLEWVERNKKYPASFKITRSENIEKERWRGLSMYDIVQEAVR